MFNKNIKFTPSDKGYWKKIVKYSGITPYMRRVTTQQLTKNLLSYKFILSILETTKIF